MAEEEYRGPDDDPDRCPIALVDPQPYNWYHHFVLLRAPPLYPLCTCPVYPYQLTPFSCLPACAAQAHKAAVIGDTVGDPLKGTSGPALNVLMKLMAIIALVFAPFVASTRDGYGLIGCSLERECSAPLY